MRSTLPLMLMACPGSSKLDTQDTSLPVPNMDSGGGSEDSVATDDSGAGKDSGAADSGSDEGASADSGAGELDCSSSGLRAWFVDSTGNSLDVSAQASGTDPMAPLLYTPSSGGVLYYCPGTHYVNLSWAGVEGSAELLRVEGQGSSSEVILSGSEDPTDGEDTVLTLGTYARVELLHLTVTAGDASAGAGISVGNDVELEMEDCALTQNVAQGEGGGMLIQGARSIVSVTGSSFSSNFAGTSGGGIYANGAASLQLVSVQLTSNTAGAEGGALAAVGSGLNLQDVQISENEAGFGGGGLALVGGALQMLNSSVTANIAPQGSGIQAEADHRGACNGRPGTSPRDGVYDNLVSEQIFLDLTTGTYNSTDCDYAGGEVLSGVGTTWGDDATFSCSSAGCL